MFVADARTGEVIKKITNTATNTHYESLSFLTSAGAWDQAGKRFVFPGLSKGDPVLTIVDVDGGRTEREIRLSEVNEIVNPAWSPDGKRIVFSAMIGGFHGLVRVRPREGRQERSAPAHDRRLRRDRSGVVARWTTDRLQHRSLHDEPRDHQARSLAAGADGDLDRDRARARRLSRGQEHQPAVGRRWPLDLFPVRSPGHHEHLSHAGRRCQDHSADQHADRRERDHGAQPGDVVCRRPPRLQRLRERRLQHLRARHRRATRGRTVCRSSAQCRGAAAAQRGGRPRRRSVAGRDVGPAGQHRGADSRAVQAEVGVGFRGAAVVRRRRRSVRNVCVGRRLVPLQRHARQSRDRDGRPGDEPLR